MTIRDLQESGIELQGKIIVKQWDEEEETYITLSESENLINKKALDKEITYMYAIDNTMVYEVK